MSRFCKLMMSLAVAAGCVGTATALDTSYYTSSSVLSEGKWVKVKVSQTGIHEITYDQLAAWGFTDPSKVTIYGYSGTALSESRFSTDIPDDLCQQYSFNSSSYKKVIFYGVADLDVKVKSNTAIASERNFYSLGAYYFITDSQPRKTTSPVSYNSQRSRFLTSHSHLEYYENEAMCPMSGGVYFFDHSLLGEPQQLQFPLKNYSNDDPFKGSLIYRFASDSYTKLTLQLVNGNEAFTTPSSSTAYPYIPAVTTELSRVFNLSEGGAVPLTPSSNISNYDAWTFSLKMPSSYSPNTTYASLDYAAIIYPRTNNIAATSQLTMFFPDVTASTDNFRVSGTMGSIMGTQIWNIDNPMNVRPYTISFNSGVASCSFERDYNATTGAARVVAFNISRQQYAVEFAGDVDNQNLHADPVPDMIIVTPPSLISEAQRLADIHTAHQGYLVKVITQDKIYNEFSSGTPSAMGLRRYIKMNYDRQPEKLRHVLLFGLGSWDNRHILVPDQEHIVTYQTESEVYGALHAKCFAADTYFGMMDDNIWRDNIVMAKIQVNVGRMPVTNISDAAIIVDKIERYFNDPPVHGSYNRALLFCDDGDSNDHLKQSDQVADTIIALSPSTTVNKVYNALYPFTSTGDAVMLREAMHHYLQQGLGYIGYAGHGRNDRLGMHEVLWSLSEIDGTDYKIPPFAMLSTCNTYSFDRASSDIAGHMIRKPNGGAINIIAACRSVYKTSNQKLNLLVARSYFSAKAGDCSGDIYRRAHNAAMDSLLEELSVNTRCYNLCGDPAIPLFFPTEKVTTSSINGTIVSAVDHIDVYPLEPFAIKGCVRDEDGKIDTSFNGIVTIDIYDGAYTVRSSSKGEGGIEAYTKDVYLDETLLASKTVAVQNGYFNASITVPAPLRPEVPNRISYYAANADNTRFAAGTFANLNVNAYDEARISHADTDAPEIVDFYINTPDFVSGDETGSEIVVYAKIAADASGINTGGGKIGNGARLMLDGSQNFKNVANALQPEADGTTTIEFFLSELSDGFHTLELSVADNADNRSFRSLGFLVVNRDAQASLSADGTTARTDIKFDIDHNFLSDPEGRLIVEDAMGNAVLSLSGVSFPYLWDLRDSSGQRVPDGHYNAFVVLRSGSQFGNTQRLPFEVME